MANCDICNATVFSGCYALHSEIVLNSRAYIGHYTAIIRNTYGSNLGMDRSTIVKELWDRLGSSVWIVCEDCIRMVPEADLTEARREADKFWAGDKTLGSKKIIQDKFSNNKKVYGNTKEVKIMTIYDGNQLAQFAQAALSNRRSISLPMRLVPELMLELETALEDKYPILKGKAHDKTRSCIEVKCENCGNVWSRDFLMVVELAESEINGIVTSSINFKRFYTGRCPSCSGETVRATFDPSLLGKMQQKPKPVGARIEECINALRDDDLNKREKAAKDLGKLGPQAKPALHTLISVLREDKNAVVRASVANTLGKIGSDAKDV